MIAIAALAAAAAMAGCAAAPEANSEGASEREPKEYTTGSNIGRRPGAQRNDGVRTYEPGAVGDIRPGGTGMGARGGGN